MGLRVGWRARRKVVSWQRQGFEGQQSSAVNMYGQGRTVKAVEMRYSEGEWANGRK